MFPYAAGACTSKPMQLAKIPSFEMAEVLSIWVFIAAAMDVD